MARRAKREEDENHERWLLSYASFMTLMFAFFVVMYAFSSMDKGKYKMFSASLSSAFGQQMIKLEAMVPLSGQKAMVPLSGQEELLLKSLLDRRRDAKLAEQQRMQQERMQSIVNNLNQVMAPLLKSGQVSITQTNRGVVLEINASALFNIGDAKLQGASVNIMAEVARVLGQSDHAIEVEGHTDDIPIHTPQFPSNWELSSARASSVVRLFIEHEVTAMRLTAKGYAANHPVVSDDTPEARARNRRVTVTIMAPEQKIEEREQRTEGL